MVGDPAQRHVDGLRPVGAGIARHLADFMPAVLCKRDRVADDHGREVHGPLQTPVVEEARGGGGGAAVIVDAEFVDIARIVVGDDAEGVEDRRAGAVGGSMSGATDDEQKPVHRRFDMLALIDRARSRKRHVRLALPIAGHARETRHGGMLLGEVRAARLLRGCRLRREQQYGGDDHGER
jgi:hypothetical protein